MLPGVRLRPAHNDGVISDIFFVAYLHHLFGDSKRNSSLPGMGRAAGSKNQLAYFARIIQREELGHPSAHGMTAHHSALEPELIENGRCIRGEGVRTVLRGRLTG